MIKLLYSLLRFFERKIVLNNQAHLTTKEKAATFLLSGLEPNHRKSAWRLLDLREESVLNAAGRTSGIKRDSVKGRVQSEDK